MYHYPSGAKYTGQWVPALATSIRSCRIQQPNGIPVKFAIFSLLGRMLMAHFTCAWLSPESSISRNKPGFGEVSMSGEWFHWLGPGVLFGCEVNDMQEGQGKEEWADGSVFEGEFKARPLMRWSPGAWAACALLPREPTFWPFGFSFLGLVLVMAPKGDHLLCLGPKRASECNEQRTTTLPSILCAGFPLQALDDLGSQGVRHWSKRCERCAGPCCIRLQSAVLTREDQWVCHGMSVVKVGHPNWVASLVVSLANCQKAVPSKTKEPPIDARVNAFSWNSLAQTTAYGIGFAAYISWHCA